jgi:Uma2 family endonuclease
MLSDLHRFVGRTRSGLRRASQPVGSTVRYPDALITCSQQEPGSRLVAGVVVVFEILSPSTSRVDRLIKLNEYAAVSSILRYVMLESTSIGLTAMERTLPNEAWRTSSLTSEKDVLRIPEVGIEIPLTDLYSGLSFPADEGGTAA